MFPVEFGGEPLSVDYQVFSFFMKFDSVDIDYRF